MAVPDIAWANRAAAIYRATGVAAPFVVRPVAAGGVAVTYADCKERPKSVRSQDTTGAWVNREITMIYVPRLDGTVAPAEGALGVFNGGPQFELGAVRAKAGVWKVERLP